MNTQILRLNSTVQLLLACSSGFNITIYLHTLTLLECHGCWPLMMWLKGASKRSFGNRKFKQSSMALWNINIKSGLCDEHGWEVGENPSKARHLFIRFAFILQTIWNPKVQEGIRTSQRNEASDVRRATVRPVLTNGIQNGVQWSRNADFCSKSLLILCAVIMVVLNSGPWMLLHEFLHKISGPPAVIGSIHSALVKMVVNGRGNPNHLTKKSLCEVNGLWPSRMCTLLLQRSDFCPVEIITWGLESWCFQNQTQDLPSLFYAAYVHCLFGF